MLRTIEAQVAAGQPLTTAQAGWLFTEAPDEALMALATEVRGRFHAPKDATWLVMAIVNYTNVCVARCDYCAFYRLPTAPDTYVLSYDQLVERIDRLAGHGGTLVGFNGGFHPKLRLQDYAALFGRLRAHYGDRLEFYELTVAEFLYYCKVGRLSVDEGARILADAGTRWVTGGGAEVLEEGFRMRHSPLKYSVDAYYDAQRAILGAGMGSTATMVIGFDETLQERHAHQERIRAFQDDTGGLLPSFLCWTYKPFNTDLGGVEVPATEYLRWLAVCRVYLHNFTHIRTSVLTRNEGALLGLRYGANDFDLPTEDEVTEKAGATISLDFERLLEHARALGFEPRRRAPFAVPQRSVAA